MEFDTERPAQLKIDMRIVSTMADDDIRWIIAWAAIKRSTFPFFSRWLHDALTQELECRNDELRESSLIAIPRLNSAELADFVQGAYVLCRLPLNEYQSKFADQVSLLILADTVAALEQFDIGTIVT